MATIRVARLDGEPVAVEARKFSHYIGNVQYWFAYHDSIQCRGFVTVTHIDTGMRVFDLSHSARAAALGDDKQAAKAQLDAFIKEKGAQWIRSVIDRAPALPPVKRAKQAA